METGATSQSTKNSSFADHAQLKCGSILSCFEHQRLGAEDFSYAKDFEYLIEQELPCFSIEVKRGKLSLLVGHYLAKVILPSGLTLEILPKISSDKIDPYKTSSPKTKPNKNLSNQASALVSAITPSQSGPTGANSGAAGRLNDLVQARKWVATMLQDIGSDNLGKTIEAINISATKPSDNSPLESYASSLQTLKPNGLPNEPTKFTGLPPVTSISNHQTVKLSSPVDKPWYQGLLAIISDKLQQVAELLPNRYRTEVNNSPKAQGKINLTAQLKNNWHRPHYLYTEQSIFDADQLLVQFLTTAWQQLQQLAQASGISSSSSVPPLPSSFQGVVALPVHQWQSSYQQLLQQKQAWVIQFSGIQADVIAQGIEWGWWLLTHSNQRLTQSPLQATQEGLPVAALMINMNHAFERWVLGKLHSWVNHNLANSRLIIHPSFDWLQQKLATSEGGLQRQVIQKLIPDACIVTEKKGITHVIDIKYKTINGANQIGGRDWQQLSTYQQYLNCPNAWLIFPRTKNFKQRLDVFINFDENRLSNQNGAIRYSTGQSKTGENCTQQMSVIPFDPDQARLLI